MMNDTTPRKLDFSRSDA